MKDKIKIVICMVFILCFIFLIIIGEIRVQKRWDKYEEKVFAENGIHKLID